MAAVAAARVAAASAGAALVAAASPAPAVGRVTVVMTDQFDTANEAELLGLMFQTASKDGRLVIESDAVRNAVVIKGASQQVADVRAALKAYVGERVAQGGQSSKLRMID